MCYGLIVTMATTLKHNFNIVRKVCCFDGIKLYMHVHGNEKALHCLVILGFFFFECLLCNNFWNAFRSLFSYQPSNEHLVF